MTEEEQAIAGIRPMPGDGPNRWTTDVPGWGISAPTKAALKVLVRRWFAPAIAAAAGTAETTCWLRAKPRRAAALAASPELKDRDHDQP